MKPWHHTMRRHWLQQVKRQRLEKRLRGSTGKPHGTKWEPVKGTGNGPHQPA